jgi:predicted FMN-binding regulatory protein PaiB
MVLFTGDEHYISPQHYTETKPKTGKVVPTWNYSSVAAYGKARIYHSSNPDTPAFLQAQMDQLTDQSESREKYLPGNWKVSDAPERYVELLKKAVIGVEIRITRLEGKFKMNQESTEGDRRGVVEGLAKAGDNGKRVAEMVRERGEKRDP